MRVQSKMCATCPWRPKTFVSLIRGDVGKEIRKQVSRIEKIHVCHESYSNYDMINDKWIGISEGKKSRRCRGSYLWRKAQFKKGAVRCQGEQYVTRG